MFLFAMITYYAGVLVWKERDAGIDDINDALPRREWPALASKLIALLAGVFLIVAAAMTSGLLVQFFHNYHRYQLGVWFEELLFIDFTIIVFWVVLAYFLHVLAPNKYIGEDAVNRALRKVLDQYRYAPPPYPVSYALVDALQAETPPNLQYLIKDLFYDITLFSNRTTNATATKRADGKFDVTIKVEAHKFKADEKGNEREVPVNDCIDIGAFAKPLDGETYGATLYRDRRLMHSGPVTYTFTVDKAPDTAGIDRFDLLIDRIPDDNTKPVTINTNGTAD